MASLSKCDAVRDIKRRCGFDEGGEESDITLTTKTRANKMRLQETTSSGVSRMLHGRYTLETRIREKPETTKLQENSHEAAPRSMGKNVPAVTRVVRIVDGDRSLSRKLTENGHRPSCMAIER
jgi:hypothetical protein